MDFDSGKDIFVVYMNGSNFYNITMSNDRSYKFIFEDFSGVPEEIHILISKGSYVAINETFDLFEVSYYSSRKFRVKENGTYQMHVKYSGTGSLKFKLERKNSS
jgi:hypothetical protein